MKIRKKLTILVIIIMLLITSSATITANNLQQTQTKLEANGDTEYWAVLISGAKYPGDNKDLAAQLVYAELIQYKNWKASHMKLIPFRDYTNRTIDESITWLKNRADENDVIFFFMSTHGGPGGEDYEPIDEPDGRDEVYLPGDSWANFINDDDLGKAFDELKSQTPHVIIFFEACYAGGIRDGSSDPGSGTGIEVVTRCNGDCPAGHLATEIPFLIEPVYQNRSWDRDSDGWLSVEEMYGNFCEMIGIPEEPLSTFMYDGHPGEIEFVHLKKGKDRSDRHSTSNRHYLQKALPFRNNDFSIPLPLFKGINRLINIFQMLAKI